VLCAWPRSRASMATTAALECQCIHQVRGQYSSRTQQQRGRQGGCTLQFVVGTTSGSVLLVVYRYVTYSTWVCLHAIPCRRRPAQFTASFSSVNREKKHCIRISVAFRLCLVKIIQFLTN
jgi:hypothetical protein